MVLRLAWILQTGSSEAPEPEPEPAVQAPEPEPEGYVKHWSEYTHSEVSRAVGQLLTAAHIWSIGLAGMPRLKPLRNTEASRDTMSSHAIVMFVFRMYFPEAYTRCARRAPHDATACVHGLCAAAESPGYAIHRGVVRCSTLSWRTFGMRLCSRFTKPLLKHVCHIV